MKARAAIRHATRDDLAAVYDVCLRTADAGADATGLYDDPMLPGHVWAGAYVMLEPTLAFVLEDDLGVAGYVLGALDTAVFEQRCERSWWPDLRRRYDDQVTIPSIDRTPDEHAVSHIHRPSVTPPEIAGVYPSHLHIDLLPRAQGSGTGRRLIETELDAMRSLGSPAAHLGVSRANTKAIGFYEHLGWHKVMDTDDTVVLGRRLDR